MSSKRNHVQTMVLTALFAAIIFIFTAYILHIPFLTGYIHFGDTFIYLAASLLPAPYAVAAAAIGAGLSDLLTFPIWVGPTLLIKSLTALCFSSKTSRIVCKRNILGLVLAFFTSVVGYYIATGLLFQDWLIPMIRIGTDIVPPLVCAVLYLALGKILDQMKIRSFIHH